VGEPRGHAPSIAWADAVGADLCLLNESMQNWPVLNNLVQYSISKPESGQLTGYAGDV
jgi:hypothetical protein